MRLACVLCVLRMNTPVNHTFCGVFSYFLAALVILANPDRVQQEKREEAAPLIPCRAYIKTATASTRRGVGMTLCIWKSGPWIFLFLPRLVCRIVDAAK